MVFCVCPIAAWWLVYIKMVLRGFGEMKVGMEKISCYEILVWG